MSPERTRVRRVTLWIAIPVLLAAAAGLAPKAFEAWRYVEAWELGEHEATVHRLLVDRWRGSLLEGDTWSTATGLRLRQTRWSPALGLRDTIWCETGEVQVQYSTPSGLGSLGTREAPPWDWGAEDHCRDAPWLELGYEAWKATVRFREPQLPR